MNKLPLFQKKSVRMDGARQAALNTARGRIVLMSVVFALAYITILARMIDLSVIQAQTKTVSPAVDFSEFEQVKEGHALRADIVDRNGILLATSLETASLYADPSIILDPQKTAEELTKIFPDLEYGAVLEKLQGDGRFVWLRRNLTPAEQYQVLKIGEPGLAFQTERRRIYPQGNLTAHFVGYGDVDGKGLAGVERSFDSYLSQGASPLRLTIDVRLQHIVRRALVAAIEEFDALGGAGIVMDIKSGDLLSAVSYPDFDPHDPSRNASARFNRVALGTYELGSVFKIFSTAAYIDHKKPSMGEMFDAREPMKVGRHKISDYHAQERIMSLPEVFMHSSNIGTAIMAQDIGTDTLKKYYADLGLFHRLDFGFDEAGAPQVPPVWREIDTLTASYGHAVAVSPLHAVAAGAASVGDGVLVPPRLVLRNDDLGSVVTQTAENKPQIRIFSPQTTHRMRQLLRLAVTDGTGRNADVPGYVVGGKTGTAEKIVNGRYDRSKRISTFLGFFPMNAPRYAILIMVDEPKGNKRTFGYATAGWVAAPAVAEIISSMAPLLGMPPQEIGTSEDPAYALKQFVKSEDEIKAAQGVQNASY